MSLQIGDVKSQIEQARGPAFPKDGMTLIFNGKVLSGYQGACSIRERPFSPRPRRCDFQGEERVMPAVHGRS